MTKTFSLQLRDAGAIVIDPFPYNLSVWIDWSRNDPGASEAMRVHMSPALLSPLLSRSSADEFDFTGQGLSTYTGRQAMDAFLASLLYSPEGARSVESLRDFILAHPEKESPPGHEGCADLCVALAPLFPLPDSLRPR